MRPLIPISIVPISTITDCSIEVGPPLIKAPPKYCDITGYEVILFLFRQNIKIAFQGSTFMIKASVPTLRC